MRVDTDTLGERIAEHAAHIDAAMHLLLTDLREFDQAGGWYRQGFQTCAHWLSWRVGWTLGTAREHVRVANKLAELPQIDEALRTGEMSYCKVRAMTRVATPANEATLLGEAQYTTGHQLETICRKYAMVQHHGKESNPKDDSERRWVRRRDQPDGMVQIVAALHPEEAATVWAALERIVKEGCRRRSGASAGDDANHANDGDVPAGTPSRGRGEANDVRWDVPAGTRGSDSASGVCDVSAGTWSGASEGDEASGRGEANDVRWDVPAGTWSGTSGREASGRGEANDVRWDVPAGTWSGTSGREASGRGEANDVRWDVPAGTRGSDSASDVRCDVSAGTWSGTSGREASGRGEANDVRWDVPAGTRGSDSASSSAARRADQEAARKKRFSRADALVTIAEEVIRGSRPDRSPIELVVTVAAADLRARPKASETTSGELHASCERDASGGCESDPTAAACCADGTAVSLAAVRRLACDAGLVGIVEGDDGAALSVGRKTRAIPAAIKRALLKRDRCCRFPGCTNRIFVEGHHLEHWVDGGETKLPNLVTLCRHHHRFVHEYGFTVQLNGTDVRFLDPDGNVVPAVPEPKRPARLGWETIRARNAELAIDADTPACGWDGGRVDLVACIDDLVRADDRAARRMEM